MAFDYCVTAGFTRLLAETGPDADPDPIEALLARVSNAGELPVGRLLAAAWRRPSAPSPTACPSTPPRALVALSVTPASA